MANKKATPASEAKIVSGALQKLKKAKENSKKETKTVELGKIAKDLADRRVKVLSEEDEPSEE